ncbi:phosphoribosyltransferase [Aeromicrobium sp.]
MRPYEDRRDAGRQLAAHLESHIGQELRRPIVFALPRGGVPVGAEVAVALGAPLDVVVVRNASGFGRREVAAGPHPDLAGRTAVVVDDGVATGATIRAAVNALRQLGPDRIVIAVPVCLSGAVGVLEEIADDVVCPWRPSDLLAVGQAYQRFDQTSDEEVRAILEGGSEWNG